MWVKASGKRLDRALKEEIFTRVLINTTLIDGWTNDPDNNQPGFRPSIETSLHAAMPHKVVIHTHPIDAVAASISENAIEILQKKLKGFNWKFIRYARPGRPLHEEVAKAIEHKNIDVLVLQNHGLITCGHSPEEAERLTYEVAKALEQERRREPAVQDDALNKLLRHHEGSRLPSNSVVHSLATDRWSLEIAKRNPYSPDHAVFCGVRNRTEDDQESDLLRHKAYIVVPGTGVVLLGNCNAATEEALEAQAEIYLRTRPNTNVHLLSDRECEEIVNWEDEKYRLQMNS